MAHAHVASCCRGRAGWRGAGRWVGHQSLGGADAEERTLVEQTGAVIEALDAAHADLLNAEAGERGYVLTGDSAFLEPYARSAAAIAGDLATLRTIIAIPCVDVTSMSSTP